MAFSSSTIDIFFSNSNTRAKSTQYQAGKGEERKKGGKEWYDGNIISWNKKKAPR
jgi:hypothetical protein